MNIFNSILDLTIWIVGIITAAKYIVLWIVKGVIKFKLIKNTDNKIIIKEYIFTYPRKINNDKIIKKYENAFKL